MMLNSYNFMLSARYTPLRLLAQHLWLGQGQATPCLLTHHERISHNQ